jgi:Fe-S-cluster containining protein
MMTPILPDDDAASYQTAMCYSPGKAPYLILDRRANGDCVYLGEAGCTIHGRAPRACQDYDCRKLFLNSDRAGRRLAIKRGEVDARIFKRGRELLGT